jgi:hypothetical protein
MDTVQMKFCLAGTSRMLNLRINHLLSYSGLGIGNASRLPAVTYTMDGPADPDSLGVIFTKDTVTRHQLKNGSFVRIHPPW